MKTQSNHLVKSTLSGTFWNYASHYSGKLVNLITLTILARLLLEEDFGVAGYATVFISFLDFPGLGIGPGLVYHDRDKDRTNTAFWLALATGLILSVSILVLAPLTGIYFKDPRAVPMTKIYSLYFPVVALGVLPSSLLSKDLSFNRKFISDLAGSISKGVLSITLAWLGFGAWSIVAGNLMNTLMTTLVLWLVWRSNWRPSFRFNREYARSLVSYGASIISVYVLGILLLNVDYLLVGRYLGAAALGVYILAFRIPELMIKQFYSSIAEVLFPVFIKMRKDLGDLKSGFLTTMRYMALITIPMAIGLAIISRPLVLTIFGEKWEEAIPVTSAIAIYTMLPSLYFISGNVFKAQGHPEIITKLHIFNLLVLVPSLWWAVTHYGTLIAVGITQVIVVFIVGTIRLIVVSRALRAPFREFVRTITPILVSTLFMAVVVKAALILFSNAAPLVQLIVSIPVGVLVYVAAIWWIQKEVVIQMGETLRAAIVKG